MEAAKLQDREEALIAQDPTGSSSRPPPNADRMEGALPGSLPSSGGVIRPQLDTWEYRIVHLDNALKAVLVSDPNTDKAAASLDVHVGSLLDPPGLAGLAHFLEHMLFYSSAKYPVEDEYSKFISDRGGSTNAWTASEDTNYQFDINWDALEPALDRFAQFFICPTISPDGVDREVRAVDSEHGKNLATDAWRQMQLLKHTANQEHPWSHFATGNLATLGSQPQAAGVNVRDAVAAFYEEHYSANLMRLAVVGRQSLDVLEGWVREKFSPIKNKEMPVPTFSPDVFLPGQTRTLLRMVPVRDVQTLELAWQVPPSQKQYKAMPLGVLSHLLGHEGEGSVFAHLKSLGWANSLVAGESGSSISSRSFFYVSVDLTHEGFAHVQEVGAVVFRYLAMLRRKGIPRAVYDELQQLQLLRFNFRDKPAPYSYATSLSSSLQLFGEEDLLLGLYNVPQVYDPDAIAAALTDLNLDTVRVCWVSKKLQDEATDAEPWYGTRHKLTPLPDEWQQACADDTEDAKLHLPQPNPFIPTDFSLLSEDASSTSQPPAGPQLVLDIPGSVALHHKVDLTFKTPKAAVYLDLQSPESYANPTTAVYTRLYVKLLLDSLNEIAYPAELAGLAYSINNTQTGIQINVSGYSHKLGTLVDAILEKMLHFKVKEDRFLFVREAAQKEYLNVKYQQPYQWAMYRRELLLNAKRWHIDDYLAVVMDLTAEGLTAFIQRLFQRVFLESLVAGNVTKDSAVALVTRVHQALTGADGLGSSAVPSSLVKEFRVLKAPTGAGSLLAEAGPNPNNDNSAIVLAFQVGPDNPRTNALAQLLVHMAKRDAFHILRTQEQLGYIVSLFNNHELLVHTIEFVLQSNVHSASHLALRANAFVDKLVQELLPAKCSSSSSGNSPNSSDDSSDNAAASTKTTADTSDSTAVADGTSSTPTSSSAEAEAESTGAEPGAGEGGVPGKDTPPSAEAAGMAAALTEFQVAVEELAKAKLEKPKKLTELAHRWWNELYYGTYLFNRQEAEVTMLRTLQPSDLQQFAADVLLQQATRRKLLILIRGSAEATAAQAKAAATAATAAATAGEAGSDGAAADGGVSPLPADSGAAVAVPTSVLTTASQQPAAEIGDGVGGAASAAAQLTVAAAGDVSDLGAKAAGKGEAGEGMEHIGDVFAWRRSCEIWPNVAALAAKPRRKV